jgi:hypothetical protein
MGSEKEPLNQRVRETVSSMSDKELIRMLQPTTSLQYTEFALHIARQELFRRRKLERVQQALASAGGQPSNNQDQSTDSNDCYIDLWRDKDFQGEHLRIEGPVEYESLRGSTENWGNDISSVRVGPNAFVLVYEDDGFKGGMVSIGPNEEVADLTEYRFNDVIESIKIVNSIRIFEQSRRSCEQPSRGEIEFKSQVTTIVESRKVKDETKGKKRRRSKKR